MKKIVALLILSSVMQIAAPQVAKAQSGDSVLAASLAFTDDDLDPIVRTLSAHTYALTAPIYVYNWFNARGRSAIWSDPIRSDDDSGYMHLQTMGKAYWQSLCSKNPVLNPSDCALTTTTFGAGNMYGPGLYLAIDPVATADYGSGAGWVLMQLHLPKGFRVLDLGAHDQFTIPDDALASLAKMGCQSAAASIVTGTDLVQFMLDRNVNFSDSDSCVLGVRKILKDRLHIDGFFYGYSATQFIDCKNSQNSGYRSSAMVLTDARKLKPADVRVFNSQTTDDIEDRTRIEMLFYKQNYYSGRSATTLPDTMSEETAPPNQNEDSSGKNLLWPDLEGIKMPTDGAAWLPANLYACSADPSTAVVRRNRPGIQLNAPSPTPVP